MNEDMLLSPQQKIINMYISLSNFICIFIISTFVFTNIIGTIFTNFASKANPDELLDISINTVTTYTDTLSKTDALVYISFVISFVISIFVAAKLSYILKFNKVKFIWIKKIITAIFTLAFTAIFALLVGSVFYQEDLKPIYEPITIFFINLFKNIIPSLFMFNEIIGLKK